MQRFIEYPVKIVELQRKYMKNVLLPICMLPIPNSNLQIPNKVNFQG